MIKICGGNPGQAARSFFMSEARLASREAAGGPALQKIEAAGRPVDIDDLPGKKQIADNFGTHGFVVNFGNIHAPAGDHPRFNRKSFAGFQFKIFHRLRYPPALLSREIAPRTTIASITHAWMPAGMRLSSQRAANDGMQLTRSRR